MRSSSFGALLGAWALAASVLGCDASSALGDAPPAARLKAESGGAPAAAAWGRDMVPPEDGPKLAPTELVVAVRAEPRLDGATIGYLRVGAKVARSPTPVGHEGCPDGWVAIRPVGYVCVGSGATTKLDHPVVRAIDVEPNRDRPMPYRYAFVRAIAPNYLRIPTKDEQLKYEMHLERHLRNWKRLTHEWDHLNVGANDVPLDERGFAVGKIPEEAQPLGMSERFGGNGSDAVPWWLRGERRIPNLSSFKAPGYAVIASRIKRHAGVALIGSFVAGDEAQNRRFAITTDARLIPADKIKADSGSPFHGADIRGMGLPVAFVTAERAYPHRANGGRVEQVMPRPRREIVPLTGRVKNAGSVRLVEAKDGSWVRSSDVRTIPKSSKLPWFATKQTRWIDISILNQTLVLWEGATPVYATLVSTGRDGLGDPKKTLSTPTGTFRIYQKHVTATMDSDVAESEFELRDVPWVMYFKGGYALHAAYWHDDFGRSRSHGCVNLAPIDARVVFRWASPDVPEHWHAAYTSDTFGQGTLVHIHE
jgi:lipoprotein-anchoring transpeptidase ErfK/SrfK